MGVCQVKCVSFFEFLSAVKLAADFFFFLIYSRSFSWNRERSQEGILAGGDFRSGFGAKIQPLAPLRSDMNYPFAIEKKRGFFFRLPAGESRVKGRAPCRFLGQRPKPLESIRFYQYFSYLRILL